MFPVKISENKAIITFSTPIYGQYSITETCEKFKDICRIKVLYLKDSKKIIVEMEPKIKTDLKEISLNFCNWVLHLQTKGI